MRAQPPMVEVAKWTFAAARMARASASVIQSAAEGIGQSAVGARVFDEGPVSADEGDPFFDSPVAEVEAGGDAPAPSVDERASFEAGSVDAPVSVPDDPASDDPSSPPPTDAALLTAARRSFFAQPEPL